MIYCRIVKLIHSDVNIFYLLVVLGWLVVVVSYRYKVILVRLELNGILGGNIPELFLLHELRTRPVKYDKY